VVLDVQWLTGAQAVLVWLSAGPVLSWQGLAFENELGCTVAKVTDSSSLAPRRLHCCYHQRKATTSRSTQKAKLRQVVPASLLIASQRWNDLELVECC